MPTFEAFEGGFDGDKAAHAASELTFGALESRVESHRSALVGFETTPVADEGTDVAARDSDVAAQDSDVAARDSDVGCGRTFTSFEAALVRFDGDRIGPDLQDGGSVSSLVGPDSFDSASDRQAVPFESIDVAQAGSLLAVEP